MKSHITLLTFLSLLWFQISFTLYAESAKKESPPDEASLVFELSFDNESTTAVISGGGSRSPLEPNKVRYVEGVHGSGVYLGNNQNSGETGANSLKYSADHLFSSDAGTISFWVKPNWDGLSKGENGEGLDYRFFSAFAHDKEGEKGKDERRIWLWMWNWLRCDLTPADGKDAPNLQWKSRSTWMKGDWWHVAVSWNKTTGRQLYLNGIPVYRTGQVALDDISYFVLGVEAPTQSVEAAFDELKIYSRSLTRSEIESQFRKFAPLDFILERRFLRAGKLEKLKLDVSSPLVDAGNQPLRVKLLSDTDQKVITRWDGEIAAKSSQSIELQVSDLAVGDYRLQCEVKSDQANWQRSFPITVYQQREAPATSGEELELGACLVDIDLTHRDTNLLESAPSKIKEITGHGKYLELGDKKWDRVAVELPEFHAERSPVVVEIEWPDDKERSMSFYLFVESKRKQHRDRLSGGVHAGGEYPNSGMMRKTRYLFYPESKHYLFEVRTLIDGLPAAVSRLKVYALAGRLPKLAIEAPAGLPTRNIGHLDEDQSFEVLMPPRSTSQLRFDYTIQVIENLLDYNDYTGQNTLSYPVFRYSWSHLDTAPVNKVDDGFRVAGWIDLLMDMLDQRGQNFFPAINLYTIAEDFDMPLSEQQNLVGQGHFLYDNNGKLIVYGSGNAYGNNPAHPAVQKKFLSQIDDLLHRFGSHSAFKGINLWMHTPVFFTSLEKGYGDYTIAVFEKQSGVKVPVTELGSERFLQRYQYLTGPGKSEWLAWREGINRSMIQEVSSRLQKAKKGARLYVNLNRDWQQPRLSKEKSSENFNLKAHCYEQFGLNLDAIDGINSVSIAPLTDPTISRSNKHWNHNAQNLNYELMTDTALFRPFRSGGQGVASLYYVYFESFMNSLSPEKYASYFQNSDPKAGGRNFLSDFSIAMAAQNPETIFAGAQPLGTMGRESESREFARNFRALPAGRYEDVSQMLDPVTARFLATPKGTWLYQTNLLPWAVKTAIEIPEECTEIRDLGNGVTVPLVQGKLEQTLKPFELRAWFIKDHQVEIGSGRVTLDREHEAWFVEQQKLIADSVTYLEKWNGEFELAKHTFQKISEQIEKGHYADAYRRINSRAIRVLPQLLKEAVKTKPEFTDDFNDEKQIGQNWEFPSKESLIAKGEITLGGQGPPSLKLKQRFEGDMIAEATISPQGEASGGWGGIIFRGAKLLLRSDGFWAVYRVNGDEKSKGELHKVKVEPGKDYRLKIMSRGDMTIFYVNGEKLLVANEKEGLEEDDGHFALVQTKYPVTIKQVKLSRIVAE